MTGELKILYGYLLLLQSWKQLLQQEQKVCSVNHNKNIIIPPNQEPPLPNDEPTNFN